MPISHEGHEYTRHLFKPITPSLTGGCHADVFLPADTSKPVPVAVTYHGGAFTNWNAQLIFIGHVKYLLDKGFAVVGLEYRMAPHARFAEIREDVLDGYRWVLDELPKIAPVDPSRVFAFGGSAGGWTTLFLGTDAHTAGVPLPRALYVVYPLAELKHKSNGHGMTYQQALDALGPSEKAKVDQLLAEPVCTDHDVSLEDPSNPSGRMVWIRQVMETNTLLEHLTGSQAPYPTDHSPVDHLHPAYPPTVLVCAAGDELIDPQQTRDVHDRLTALGVESKLIEVPDMPHGALEQAPDKFKPGGEWYDSVLVAALDFCITRCQ